MSPEFNEVYEKMLVEYPFGPRPVRALFFREDRETLRLLEQALEEVCQRRKVALRPDAKYFLVSNFHQMVIVPVTTVHGTQSRKELSEMIRTDMDLIISAAASQASKEREISGGRVLRTVAEVWGKLKTNAQNLWS